MPNHLAAETSPYLQQHKDNPVDWYPWGPVALERARAEDKPILLSVGYSTCHWCHVMAHESFEDPATAAVMNAHFVCIKVDREERPDLDQIYQAALRMLTRRAGGWPLTMFLMPDQTPFFGGTYFPREARYNLPAFVGLLQGVAAAFHQRRAEIEAQNQAVRAALAETSATVAGAGALDVAPIRQALADIKQGFDGVSGGFGGAPKFPRPAELDFLFWSGDTEARNMVLLTLEKMALGGVMDQLGGGFFRYSVDAQWQIPHFEKMLYDNGPLLGLYADAWAVTANPLFARVAEALVAWLEREMTSPKGAFHSALDADSEHEEGKFYVWSLPEVASLLTPEEHAVARLTWGLDSTPNFENHAWHLNVVRGPAEVARGLGCQEETVAILVDSARAKLFAGREGRVRPGRDDKVLTSWNALMIKGLARAARRFSRPDWMALARRAADALHAAVWKSGRLLASHKDGQAKHNAYLDDYAFLLDGLLELLQAGWRDQDWQWAVALADALLDHFEDEVAGGFFFTSHDHEKLIQRAKPGYDNAQPSGNGVAARALNRMGVLTGEARHVRAAERTVGAFMSAMVAQPAPHPSLLGALEDLLKPPRLAVLGGPEPELSHWKVASNRLASARDLVLALPDGATRVPPGLDKPRGGYVNAHVCSGVTCMPEIFQLTDLTDVFRTGDVQ
ncbi:MAG: thioredoxin domain-containing protein [Thiobacillus sp.]|nr:thioredoxin domain-containing protein [Thiobacillus sp.]